MKKMIIALLCGLLLLSGCANAQISNNDTGASAASSEKEATTYEYQLQIFRQYDMQASARDCIALSQWR